MSVNKHLCILYETFLSFSHCALTSIFLKIILFCYIIMLSEDNFKLIPINKNPLLLLLHLQEKHLPLKYLPLMLH